MYLFDNFIYLSTHIKLNSSSIKKLFDYVHFVSKKLYSVGWAPNVRSCYSDCLIIITGLNQILLQSLMQDKMVLKKKINSILITLWNVYTGKNSIRVALWVLGNKTKKVKGKSLHKKSQPSILWVPLKGAHTYITDGPKNGGENFILRERPLMTSQVFWAMQFQENMLLRFTAL